MRLARSLGLITLGSVLCVSVLAGRDTNASSQVATELPGASQSPSVSPFPTPQHRSETKRPNAVRRLFSWTFDQLRRPFRKEPQVICGLPMTVSSVTASKSLITFCPTTPISNPNCSRDREVKVVADVADPERNELAYSWTVTGGTIRGEGREATWDLSGVAEGTYTATVEVDDGHQHTANGSTSVTIALCSGCDRPPPPCPTVSVSCPDRIDNQATTFEAIVTGGDPEMKLTYNWSVTAGKIISGQGTSKITVDISDLGGRSITAAVLLGGAHPACTISQASCTKPH